MPAKKSDAPAGLRRYFKNAFRWANILVIVLTVMVYLAPYVSPAVFWPLSLIAPLYPWFLLANLFFILWWLFWRKWNFILSLVCILAGWGYFTAYIGLHFSATPAEGDLQVLTFNLHDLKDLPFKEGGRGRDMRPLLDFLDEIGKPDILCLQELHESPAAELAQAMGFYHHHYPEKGTAILSRFPLEKTGTIPFENSGNSAIWADVQWEGQSIRIFNLHLQSNRVSTETQQLSGQKEIDKKYLRRLRVILRKYKRAALQRIEQVEGIRAEIEKSPHPYIICGDFNDTPLSYTYHRLSKGFFDAFRQTGKGLGTTYARFPPSLRIDYVLYAPELESSACKVYRKKLSDHYPVEAWFKK